MNPEHSNVVGHNRGHPPRIDVVNWDKSVGASRFACRAVDCKERSRGSPDGLRLPAHCRENSVASARMVEEEKFFDWAGIHLAVFRQFKRHLCESVGLAGCIEPE